MGKGGSIKNMTIRKMHITFYVANVPLFSIVYTRTQYNQFIKENQHKLSIVRIEAPLVFYWQTLSTSYACKILKLGDNKENHQKDIRKLF